MRCVDRVLVVGGGVSGMSLAICLQQTGIAADIVEINPTWGTYGAGISLTGPALRAFKRLGVLDRVEREGFCSMAPSFAIVPARFFSQPQLFAHWVTIFPIAAASCVRCCMSILADATRSRGVNVRTA